MNVSYVVLSGETADGSNITQQFLSQLFGSRVCHLTHPQQTRDVDTMLAQCWAVVVDGGPILGQYWVNVTCLLGCSPWLPISSRIERMYI